MQEKEHKIQALVLAMMSPGAKPDELSPVVDSEYQVLQYIILDAGCTFRGELPPV